MKWFPWAALVALTLLLVRDRHLTDKALERLAVNAAATRQLEQEADSLRALVDSGKRNLDTVWVPRWRTVREEAARDPTDTAAVRVALGVADSTINACQLTLTDCQRLALVERARGDSLEAQRDLWRRVAQPRFTWHLYGATNLRGGLYAGAEARVRLLGVEAFGRLEQRLDSAGAEARAGVIVRP